MDAIQLSQINQTRRRQAMYKYALIRAKLSRIARHIAAGGSAGDSGYDGDYRYLVSELGTEAFNSEVNRLLLVMEEDGTGGANG